MTKQKTYLDEGKYAAPRWLVYPELDAFTIGWRMGYGEDYALNEPWHTREFNKLFPQPKNWLFNPRKSDFERFPVLGYLWDEKGRPKYSKIESDPIEVNDFITIENDDLEFRNNALHFKSIEHAVLFSKVSFFNSIDPYNTTFDELKGFEDLTEEESESWEVFKYTVLLNASYYRFMPDEKLKEKLLSTGEKPLIYVSDDEWGGDDNLFGFALMELRDEIRRLYKNGNLIDWEYTEYLKHKNPYEDPIKRNPNDRQSPEYMIMRSTIDSGEYYVRDINLKSDLFERYEIGQTITERAFVDATNRIGGLATSHRYLILSNQFKDLSEFEKNTNWNLHITARDSVFKILDIYTKDGKSQIFLLQLPKGFEEVFDRENDLIEDAVSDSREFFDKCLKEDPIKEVSSPDWLERVSFPLGMDNEGNFF